MENYGSVPGTVARGGTSKQYMQISGGGPWREAFFGMKRRIAALVLALCVLAAGPMLVIFPFFQRYFSKGLTLGAVKG